MRDGGQEGGLFPPKGQDTVRILVNAVAARMGGAATHLPAFLRTAATRYPEDSFVACVNRGLRLPTLPANVSLVETGELRSRITHAAWDLWGVSRLARQTRADLVISLLNFGPIRCPVPHIVFQRNPTYFCHHYLRTLTPRQTVEITAARGLAYAVMRGADRIVTPSGAMRDMIRAVYPDLPAGKFHVIPHGIDHVLTPRPTKGSTSSSRGALSSGTDTCPTRCGSRSAPRTGPRGWRGSGRSSTAAASTTTCASWGASPMRPSTTSTGPPTSSSTRRCANPSGSRWWRPWRTGCRSSRPTSPCTARCAGQRPSTTGPPIRQASPRPSTAWPVMRRPGPSSAARAGSGRGTSRGRSTWTR